MKNFFQERKKGRVLGPRVKVVVRLNSIALEVMDGEFLKVETINRNGDSESGQANKVIRLQPFGVSRG